MWRKGDVRASEALYAFIRRGCLRVQHPSSSCTTSPQDVDQDAGAVNEMGWPTDAPRNGRTEAPPQMN